jgi:hypothetical protein
LSRNKKILFSDSFLIEFCYKLDLKEVEKKQKVPKQAKVLARLAK